MFRLEGRVALVTGGSRGLGLAIASALGGAGSSVAVLARTDAEIGRAVQALREAGTICEGFTCDMTEPDAVAGAARECRTRLGPVDILVNNAGNALIKPLVPLPARDGAPRGDSQPISDAEWSSVMDTHLTGAMRLTRALAGEMLERRWGRVINISSITTRRIVGQTIVYDTAKGAMISLTRSLAHEWARFGVTVNAIAPGQFRTAMSAGLHDDDRIRGKLLSRIPMRRFGEPAELGALAVYLASDEASFITGQCIYADGGEGL